MKAGKILFVLVLLFAGWRVNERVIRGRVINVSDVASIPNTSTVGQRFRIESTGAEYVIEATNPISPDGNIVAEKGNNYAVLQPREKNIYNLLDAGAIANDTVSDKAAIDQLIEFQKAIDDSIVVRVPEGEYILATTMSLTQNAAIEMIDVHGLTWKGDGSNSTTFTIKSEGAGYTNRIGFVLRNSSNITFDGIKFQGWDDPTDTVGVDNPKGIDYYNPIGAITVLSIGSGTSDYFKVTDCEFRYFQGAVIFHKDSANHIEIYNNRFLDNRHPVNNNLGNSGNVIPSPVFMIGRSNDIRVKNNYFEDNYDSGVDRLGHSVYIESEPAWGNHTNVVVAGNTFNGTNSQNFASFGGNDFKAERVIGGLFEGNKFNLSRGVLGGGQWTFRNNFLRNSMLTLSGSGPKAGPKFIVSNEFYIDDPFVDDLGYGIIRTVTTAKNFKIIGNYMEVAEGVGNGNFKAIDLEAGGTGYEIRDNVIKGFGICIEAGENNATIANQVVDSSFITGNTYVTGPETDEIYVLRQARHNLFNDEKIILNQNGIDIFELGFAEDGNGNATGQAVDSNRIGHIEIVNHEYFTYAFVDYGSISPLPTILKYNQKFYGADDQAHYDIYRSLDDTEGFIAGMVQNNVWAIYGDLTSPFSSGNRKVIKFYDDGGDMKIMQNVDGYSSDFHGHFQANSGDGRWYFEADGGGANTWLEIGNSDDDNHTYRIGRNNNGFWELSYDDAQPFAGVDKRLITYSPSTDIIGFSLTSTIGEDLEIKVDTVDVKNFLKVNGFLINEKVLRGTAIDSTTNSNGEVTVAHGAGFTPDWSIVTVVGDNMFNGKIISIDGTNLVVLFTDESGLDVVSQNVSFYWEVSDIP